MALTSREKFFEQQLTILGHNNALKALDILKQEMCREKGYTRYDGSHYYFHPLQVAQCLLNFGINDEKIITAALLHDIIEDVPGYNKKILSTIFDEEVAEIVELVSKKEGYNYHDEVIMNQYLENISLNYKSALVKTADRMHNFSDLKTATLEKRLKQVNETEKYFIPFFKKCRNLYPRYAAFFFQAKTRIEPHLWEIQEHHNDLIKLQNRIKELEEKLNKQNTVI